MPSAAFIIKTMLSNRPEKKCKIHKIFFITLYQCHFHHHLLQPPHLHLGTISGFTSDLSGSSSAIGEFVSSGVCPSFVSSFIMLSAFFP